MALLNIGSAPEYRNKGDGTAIVSVDTYVLDSGVATLSSGVATISTAHASASRPVLLTYYSVDGNLANVAYDSIVAATSFRIVSSNEDDTNKVAWAILQ